MLPRLPLRVNAKQAAELIGCQRADVFILVAAGLLKPLGRPVANAEKFFSTEEVLGLDAKSLARLSQSLYEYRRHRNRKNGRRDESDEQRVAA